ncbi:MAG: DMT family transporter [Candidatus Moranbacteria bacterium]|nr:DMT family transporter [Candidatus Moranbacteria bacterium]
MGISSAIIFGLIAMIGLGLSGVLARDPSRRLGSDRSLFWRQVFLVILQIPLLVFFFPKDLSWQGLAWAVAVGVAGYFPIHFFYRAISNGRVGVVAPIANSSAVITAILAVYVLGEPFGVFRVVGLVLALSGVILLSVDFRDWKNSALLRSESGIPFAVAACLGWGVVMFLFRYPVRLIGPIPTSFIVETSALVISAIRLRSQKISFDFPDGYGRTFLWVGLAGVVGAVAYDFGLMTSAVAVVAVLNMTNPVIAAAYERFVFKERLSFRQVVGMFLAIAGAALVAAI